MDTKKLLCVLLVATTLALAFGGCAPTPAPAPTPTEAPTVAPPTPTKAPVEITWLQFWDADYGEDVMDELCARFEAQNPDIKVKRVNVPWDGMFDSMIASAQAKAALYDVVAMEPCCWVASLVKLGALEPLGPWLDKSPDFVEGLMPLCVTEWLGEPYVLNWYIMPYAYAYVMEVFEEAGLEPPRNWDEMIEVTKALNESGVVEYGLGATLNHPIQTVYYHFGGRLAQLGGRMYDENGCAVFNSPEGVQTMEDWREFYQSGELMPGSIGMNENDLLEFIKAGRVAAMWNGPWVGVKVRLDRPDITMAFAPAWTDKVTGSGGYQWAGTGNSMMANSAHKEKAWRFMQFLLSDETTLWMIKKVGVTYATKAAFAYLEESDDPILREVPAMANQDPEHNLFLAPVHDFFTVHDEFVAAFQDVLEGRREAQEALNELVKLWNKELPQCQ